MCMKTQNKNADFETELLAQCGERFKALRKAKGYSNYEQFAYLHDIGRSQYGKYEKGADMRLSTFFRVLKALDIHPVDFFKDGFPFEVANSDT